MQKCCPLPVLESLAGGVIRRGWQPVWLIGPDEMERFGHAYIARLQATAPALYEESVEVAADLVCGADAFIGNDAGMTHVAALAGVPTVAIFGPTDPRIWRPLGLRCHVVPFPRPQSAAVWIDDVVRRMTSEP